MLRFVLPALVGVLIIVAASVVIFANVFGIRNNIPFLAPAPSPIAKVSTTGSDSSKTSTSTPASASAVIASQPSDSGASGQPATTVSVSGTDVSNATLLNQIQQLQATINQLSARVTALEKRPATTTKTTYVQTTTPQSTPTPSAPIYIPLGTGGSSTGLDWTTIPSQSIIINTAQYPGYTNMTLQVNLLVYQGNGTAYAQLFNTTTGTAVISSQVSTTSSTFTQLSSGNFTLTPGQNTYVLQLKSSTGYAATAGNASIVVAF